MIPMNFWSQASTSRCRRPVFPSSPSIDHPCTFEVIPSRARCFSRVTRVPIKRIDLKESDIIFIASRRVLQDRIGVSARFMADDTFTAVLVPALLTAYVCDFRGTYHVSCVSAPAGVAFSWRAVTPAGAQREKKFVFGKIFFLIVVGLMDNGERE